MRIYLPRHDVPRGDQAQALQRGATTPAAEETETNDRSRPGLTPSIPFPLRIRAAILGD